METVTRARELRALVAERRRAGQRIGLVPTMGNLHAGHYSLIALARRRADCVVASVFVNPTQFGPGEDFARYPRTPEADAIGLAQQRCDVLFLPPVEEVYPLGATDSVEVRVAQLGDVLEGAIRPGHFNGVATVVAKLFNLVQPDLAVFGRKDYQQLLVIRRLARDLAFPVEIVDAPTLREANGLAMSSRNQYLSPAQREQAGAIYSTLEWMRVQACGAGANRGDIESGAHARLDAAGLAPDYAVIRRAADLKQPAAAERGGLIALIAARLGPARLIDNLGLDV